MVSYNNEQCVFLRFKEEQAMAVGHPQFDFLTPLNRHLRNNRTNPDNSPIGKSDKTTTLLGPNATIDQVGDSS
jgi:hypothetical protein